MVIDAVDVSRGANVGRLTELPADKPAAADFLPASVTASNHTRNGKTCAVTTKLGYYALAFNKFKLHPADIVDMATTTTGKYVGSIAIHCFS